MILALCGMFIPQCLFSAYSVTGIVGGTGDEIVRKTDTVSFLSLWSDNPFEGMDDINHEGKGCGYEILYLELNLRNQRRLP